MKSLIEAVKNNDLVETKKLFAEMMRAETAKLVEAEKIAIAKSVVIEGEEKSEPEDDEKDEDKGDKEDKETKKED